MKNRKLRIPSSIEVFKYRDFSFVWLSTTFVATGTQMESAVLAWYVLELTDSPVLVGMIAGARMVLRALQGVLVAQHCQLVPGCYRPCYRFGSDHVLAHGNIAAAWGGVSGEPPPSIIVIVGLSLR